ncbi:hypothetical protein AB0F15_44910 [Amycolatopsis sp. NPDC026612]|uniref:hypothetical protein n=1 Tax=Amycolatopsis sp. NPDC026612 TaxID=3155466 RepID=UPI0033D7DE01
MIGAREGGARTSSSVARPLPLLFFEADAYTGGPGKALFGVPRTHVAITEPQRGFLVKFELYIHGWEQAMTLSMPPFPPSLRKKGRQLVALLPRLQPTAG